MDLMISISFKHSHLEGLKVSDVTRNVGAI